MSVGEAVTAGSPLEAPEVVGKIESDFFCACHYNLHGLDVHRDVRLDMAVVRCPECGKFHAAGVATGAGRVWLSRLAAFLIALWIVFLIAGLVVVGFGLFGLDVASVEGFMGSGQLPRPGGGFYYVRVPFDPRDADQERMLFGANIVLCAGSILAGWMLGAAGNVFLWHLKRPWLLVLLLVPLIPMGIFGIILWEERRRYSEAAIGWIEWRLASQLVFQWVGIVLGIRFGRAITRVVIRVILTRRLVQHVRFLWTADGKVPPGMHG